MNQKNPVLVPNMPDSYCFACGPANDRGLQMKFYKTGNILYSEISIPEYMSGWNGVAHGGILSTLLDEVMGWGAIVLLKKFILTKSMTVNYLSPVRVLDMLRVESEVKERISEREAIMEARILNSEGKVCVTATGIFALMNKEFLTRLDVTDKNQIDYFENFFNTFGVEETVS